MGLVPVQGFAIGDRAWFADGRNGIVSQATYEPELGIWLYFIDGIGGLFDEPDLLHDPPVEEEGPLPEGRLLDGASEEAPEEAQDALTREDLRFHVALFHQPEPSPELGLQAVEDRLMAAIQVVAGLLAEARVELGARLLALEDASAPDTSEFATQLDLLESTITTRLSDIQDRAERLEKESQESSGGGFFGLVGGVGGFLRNPFTWFMDRAGDAILAEVEDGLNR